MPGPLPKPASQRRRRNVESRGVRLPVEGRTGPIPSLVGARDLLPASRELWRLWWRSPMAVTWIRVDEFPLRRLLGMIDDVERGKASAATLGEVRQLEDRFGLSPIARRRLNYEISAAAGLAELHVLPEPRETRSTGDPRLRDESAVERMTRLGLDREHNEGGSA